MWKKEQKPPLVGLQKMNLSDNVFVNENGQYWTVPNLIQYCREKKYQVFKLPLAGVNIESLPWKVRTLDDFLWHSKRIKDADLKYPVLLDNYGKICDGYHRVCKAILEGCSEIDAIRIDVMPEPDGKEEE